MTRSKGYRMKKLLLILAALVLPLSAGAQTEKLAPATGVTSVAALQTIPVVKKLLDAGYSVKTPDIVKVVLTPRGCTTSRCVKTVTAHNARVNAGAQYVANQIGNAGSVSTNVASFIALSSDTSTVLATDTTCPSELTTNGMNRKVSTFAYTTPPASLGAAATYTLSNSYSATGSYTINKLCLFTLVSGGTMLFETLLGSTVSGGNGDTINVVWTVNE
jgi:hypothetical protein